MEYENRWGIYTNEGFQGVDSELEEQFEKIMQDASNAILRGEPPLKVAIKSRDLMYSVMDGFEGYGTRDTEPESLLVSRINKELKLNLNSLSR